MGALGDRIRGRLRRYLRTGVMKRALEPLHGFASKLVRIISEDVRASNRPDVEEVLVYIYSCISNEA